MALVVLFLLLAFCHQVSPASLRVTRNSTLPATLSNATLLPEALGPGEVHSWRLPASASQCRGSLVVEVWEDKASMADAMPLQAGGLLCPVVAPQPVNDLAAPSGKSHATWVDFLSEPWRLQGGSGGLWWDAQACTRQLPYSWIVLGQKQLQQGAQWYLHMVNQRGRALPSYSVRVSCSTPAAVRCPEPRLEEGPCSGRGTCVSPKQPATTGAAHGACACPLGWAGIGCEAPTDVLAPSVRKQLARASNQDLRLVASAAANREWGLAQLQVPAGVKQVTVELEADWSQVPLPVFPDSLVTRPHLCVTTDNNEAAFAEGRLDIPSMTCTPQPLSYPLDSRTFLTLPWNTTTTNTTIMYVLVLDIGGYPVYARAAVTPVAEDASCPFGCSNHVLNCAQATCQCNRYGTRYGGRVCQYYYNDLTSFMTFTGGRTIDSADIALEPGQVAWWLVGPMPPPLLDPTELSGGSYRARRALQVTWSPAGQAYPVKDLLVTGYPMAEQQDNSSGTLSTSLAPLGTCWTMTKSGVAFNPNCGIPGSVFQMGVRIRNTGQTRQRFRLSIARYQDVRPRTFQWGGILNYVPAAVSITLAIFSAYLWNKRRQYIAETALRRRRVVTTANGGGDVGGHRGVPPDVVSTFPTKSYCPPAAKTAAAAPGEKPPAQLPAAAQQQLGVAPASGQAVARPEVLQVVVVGNGPGTEGQAAAARGQTVELVGIVGSTAVDGDTAVPPAGTTGDVPQGASPAQRVSNAASEPRPAPPAQGYRAAEGRDGQGADGTPAGDGLPSGTATSSAPRLPTAGADATDSAKVLGDATDPVNGCPAASSASAVDARADSVPTTPAPAASAAAGAGISAGSAPAADGAAGSAAAAGRPPAATAPEDATAAGEPGAAGGRPSLEATIGGAFRRMTRALSTSWAGTGAASSLDDDVADEESCPICLIDYEAGDLLRWLPCHHAFHQSCIDTWMASNHTCPVCRLDLLPPAPEDTSPATSATPPVAAGAPPAANSPPAAPSGTSAAAQPPATATGSATTPTTGEAPPAAGSISPIATTTAAPPANPPAPSPPSRTSRPLSVDRVTRLLQ